MILFVTNADTELLCLRTVAERLEPVLGPVRAAHPGRLEGVPPLTGVRLVVVRLLGGRRAWAGFDQLRVACARVGVPFVAFGGEAAVDRDLAEASAAPLPTVLAAFEYLVQGGARNLEQLLRFLSDELLGTTLGSEPPVVIPECGVYLDRRRDPGRPVVGVVFYRAHMVAGNTRFVDELCGAVEAAGGDPVALFAYSLRAHPGVTEHPVVAVLREVGADVVATTVLAAGAMAEALEAWDPGALAALDVPVLQAVCATTSAEAWRRSPGGLTPLDVAMSVAIPEFDGRIVSVPFSFKEEVDEGAELGSAVSAYRTVPDRLERVAGLAVALGRLRQVPVHERRIAVVLSAYPTKRARLGNAVGLDTPASVLALLDALQAAGYRVDGPRGDPDQLMAELADGLVYGSAPAPTAAAVGRLAVTRYRAWYESLHEDARATLEAQWGPPPGTVSVRRGTGGEDEFVFSGRRFGNVVVVVQPPRGFGEDPVAVYHSPQLPPTHHYLAFYRWLSEGFAAHAVVHVGKHGTLEWLPGKGVGLSASCYPDLALGDLPLVYPFVVNDPGEGTQAKRRSHAIIVDHLVPPLTRADTYDDLARLEDLLDQHAQLASLDPAKLPAVRAQVWDALVAAEIHRDLGLDASRARQDFDDPAFDDLLVEVDGYLCELKDAQIRGGLHVLGRPPAGRDLLELVAAVTRLPQGRVGSLRAEAARALGLGPSGWTRQETDRVEAQCLEWLERCQRHHWDLQAAVADGVPDLAVLGWVCRSLVPALGQTTGELDAVLDALDGRFVPPGPSGAPSRGAANVLPTGRNFYALDPRAVPSRLAWDVGWSLAAGVVARHLADEGRYPRAVGLVIWGTSAMRTGGDDVAEALALLGVRPRWSEGSGRVEGLELMEAAELGRPRVDVTVRVSGFFRDAFPQVLELLDHAVALAAAAKDPWENPVAKSGSEPRVFGPPPGAYGSGILPLLEAGNWETDHDLASVYLAWGGWAYGGDGSARPAEEAFARRLEAIEVAVKNQDNREHDIFDSDDYLQDHGGMVAAARALSGRSPMALFGDSSDPARPRVRSLAEEAARVVRTRVLNPKWLAAMERHGYKGAFEMAATVDYLFGYDATARVVEDWMYERVTEAYVADPARRAFFARANPWALRAIAERLLEAAERGLWQATEGSLATLRAAVLEGEGLEEQR
jgi:cobaltochelatase CobN